jgi:site-specific recombinase XerD
MPPGPLIYRVRKGGRIEAERLSEQAIYDLLRRRAKRAGVNDFSPHDCRRTLAGDLLDRGVDISRVSRMLGHAQIGTTARYDRRPEEAKRRAATTIHIPYRRRRG